jgi:hypothetical protein
MKNKSKNILLIILLVAVMGLAAGYAALSQTLAVNGVANISAEWDVKIASISEKSVTGAVSTVTPSVGGDGLSATFNVDLLYPGATAVYEVNIQNAGSIDARLESVSGIEAVNAQKPTGVTYTIDAHAEDSLASGQSKTYTVTVNWNVNDTSIPVEKTKTATITLNYVQAH